MGRDGWVMVVCSALAVAGACKKKDESAPAPPPADVSPPPDAGVAPPADAAAAADPGTGAAVEAGPAAPPPGAGMQWLAGWMGGTAAAPAAPSPPLDLLRSTGRGLLAQAEESPLAAALDAAELAGVLAEKEAGAPAPPAPPASIEVPPYDPADPCGAFVPMLVACVQSEIGEALAADELARATAECREQFNGWDRARQDRLRACVAAPDCAARLACARALDDEVEGGGNEPPPPAPPIGPLPPDADFCTKLAYRTTACIDIPVTGEVLQPQIEECRRSLDSIPVEMRRQWETCFDRPCDELFDCMSAVEPAGGAGDTASGSLGVSPPDPAQVAALSPQARAFCGELAGKFDACWDVLSGAAAGAADPSVAATMAGARRDMRKALEDACLQSAVASPGAFESVFGMFRPCLAVPCDRLLECLTNTAGGSAGAAP